MWDVATLRIFEGRGGGVLLRCGGAFGTFIYAVPVCCDGPVLAQAGWAWLVDLDLTKNAANILYNNLL